MPKIFPKTWGSTRWKAHRCRHGAGAYLLSHLAMVIVGRQPGIPRKTSQSLGARGSHVAILPEYGGDHGYRRRGRAISGQMAGLQGGSISNRLADHSTPDGRLSGTAFPLGNTRKCLLSARHARINRQACGTGARQGARDNNKRAASCPSSSSADVSPMGVRDDYWNIDELWWASTCRIPVGLAGLSHCPLGATRQPAAPLPASYSQL